jgi:hypothetical protein
MLIPNLHCQCCQILQVHALTPSWYAISSQICLMLGMLPVVACPAVANHKPKSMFLVKDNLPELFYLT